jgi:hypothetical protein
VLFILLSTSIFLTVVAALKDHKRSHPTYNNQNDTTSSGLLLPNIVGTPMMVQQPIFPSFMSSLSSGIKQEQTNNNIDETTEIKTTVKNMDVESNMNNTDDIESILKYRDDTISGIILIIIRWMTTFMVFQCSIGLKLLHANIARELF